MDFLMTAAAHERERAASQPTSRIGTHTGVILRIRFNGEPLLQTDSDALHYLAKFGGYPGADGWAEILGTVGGLTVEVSATRLPNDYPDPDEDEDLADEDEDLAAEQP